MGIQRDEFYFLFLLLKADGENEMKYLAHRNEKREEQDLREHLEAVAGPVSYTHLTLPTKA